MKRDQLVIPILFLSLFIGIANLMLIAPLLELICKDINMGTDDYGLILFIYPALSFITGILCGPISDKHGRRRMIIGGLSGFVISSLLTGISPNLTLLIVFRGLSGVCGAIVGSSVIAYVGDYFTGVKRLKAMGNVAGGSVLAQIAGIPIGIWAAGEFSWRVTLYMFSGIAAIILVLTYLYLPSPKVELRNNAITPNTYLGVLKSFAYNQNILISIFSFFLIFTGVMVFSGIYPSWLYAKFPVENINNNQIAHLFAIGGFGAWVGTVLSGRIASRFQNKIRYVSLVNLAQVAFQIMIPIITGSFYYQFIFYFFVMMTASLRTPVFQTIIMGFVSPAERGTLAGILNALIQLGAAIGAFIGSYLYNLDNTFVSNIMYSAVVYIVSSALIICIKEKMLVCRTETNSAG